MVGEPLLLLANVELLDVVYQFLLQTVLVVFHVGYSLQPFHNPRLYLLHARLLIRLYAFEQSGNVVYLLRELPLQCRTLLIAEPDERVYRLVNRLASDIPLLIVELLHIAFCRHVRHAQQCQKPVLRFGNARRRSDVLYLPVVVLHQCGVYWSGVCGGVFLYPYGEIHLTAYQSCRYRLPYLHLLLAVKRCYAGGKVERFAVE